MRAVRRRLAEMTSYEVTAADTAVALGSGDVPVLATPRVIAWLEAETCRVATPLLGPDQTTVGIRVEVDHLAASAVGATIEVTAEIATASDRMIEFDVQASDATTGDVVARGLVRRAIVHRDKFLSRLAGA